MEAIWFALAAKLAATAAIVVVACLVVERAGPLVGAMVATLPVSAGPAYTFLALEHGSSFIAGSAPASLTSLGATACFVTTYGALARSHGRLLSTGGALCCWVVTAALLRNAVPGLWPAAALDALIFTICLRLVVPWRRAKSRGGAPASRWDIPVRAIAAMGLVASVLAAGRLLGPQAAGLLALAPVVMTSLAILLHPRIGGPGAAAVMANTLPGLMGNAVAVVALGLAAVPLGSAAALLLALAICLGWNAGVLAVARHRTRRRVSRTS